MKLIRFGEQGYEHPGVIIDDRYFDVSHIIDDYNASFFSNGGREYLSTEIKKGWFKRIDQDVRLLPPIAHPSKIVCVGPDSNGDSLKKNEKIVNSPSIFLKSIAALSGPNDNVILPRNSLKTDCEVELAIVIAKEARYVPQAEAENYIGGYIMHNNYNDRDFQMEGKDQWAQDCSFDTFAPMGPFLATADEMKKPDNMRMWLKVNGDAVLDRTPVELAFEIPYLIHYVSQQMTLLPGDVVSTGFGLRKRSVTGYLKDGDLVEAGIEGLGECRQRIKSSMKQGI